VTYPGSNPFDPHGGDPFGAPPPTNYGPAGGGFGTPPPTNYGPAGGGFGTPPPTNYGPVGAGFGAPPGMPPTTPQQPLNTLAVLSPVFGVLLPPAGVALGHLALPQIRRTGERGRGAAIAGLVIGYVMCVVLIAGLLWWATNDSSSDTAAPSSTAPTSMMTRVTTTAPTRQAPPSTVTSVAPPNQPPRVKLDLATVPIGACVEIQRRSTESDQALDLYGVDCEHRTGVYTVTNRVSTDSQCRSVYVAAPPDRSFAVCLNPY